QFRITLGCGTVFGFAQNAVRGGGNQLPAQLVDLQNCGAVLRLACRSVCERLRRAQDAMRPFELVEALLILVHGRLEFLELAIEPNRSLRRCLYLRLAVLLAVGVDQRVHHRGRQGRVPSSKANFNQPRAGQRLYVKALLKSLQQPSLGCWINSGTSLRIGMKAGKAAGKIATETGRLVKLGLADYSPRQPIAAKDIGHCLKSDGSGKDRGRDRGLR